jgi:hypothetical protein
LRENEFSTSKSLLKNKNKLNKTSEIMSNAYNSRTWEAEVKGF